jgi:hypothetical protein
MRDRNNKKIEVGDIIYYAKFSEIQESKVVKVYQKALLITCARGKQSWANARTGNNYVLVEEGIENYPILDNIPVKKHNSTKRINVWKADGIKTNQVLIKRKTRKTRK